MNRFIPKKATATAIALAMGLSGTAFAQETSSAIRGTLTDTNGQPISSAQVTIIHQPSGRVTKLSSNDLGTFVANGLRVGGPYRVIIDTERNEDRTLENVFLNLGEAYRLRLELGDEIPTSDIETISVTGSVPLFTSSGGSSSFGEEDISRTPTFNRDLKDVVRNNPLATVDANGQLSVGGANPRFNSITVDGIGQNDDFGLNSGGYPTGRSPISLDAVEQISIDTTPFTAKVGGFSGGHVNAVTKSGTNETHGSLFYEFMNDSLAGDAEAKRFEESDAFKIGKESTFGASLGGAIKQDELFYFVSYEEFNKDTPLPFGIGNAGANPSRVTQADYELFSKILKEKYGLSDDWNTSPEESDKKLLVKLDWNINDAHRADFTYQYQDNKEDRNFSDSSRTLKLNSAMYEYATETSNYAAHLYSDWNDDFSTEISVSYKDVTANSHTNSDIAEVNVRTDSGGTITFGTDSNRHANVAENENLKFNFDANYLYGDHDIKFGYQLERLRLYNLYVADSKGTWNFESDRNGPSWSENFANGKADSFTYSNAYTNNANDAAYDMVRFTHALYVEDNFALTDDLDVTFGLRYERMTSDDKPNANAAFQKTYGYSNTENLDGLDIVLPRVGFQYYVNEDLTVRGGVGRYSGGQPNVWVANSFTNDGITLVDAPYSATSKVTGQADFTKVPQSVQDSLVKGAGATNYVDPNFEMPSDWRAQLGMDYTLDIPYLGDGFAFSAEATYVKKEDAAFWIDTSRKDGGKRTADGGRIIYESIYEGDLVDNYDLMLTNADKSGRSLILSTTLAKNFDNGVRMRASYTNQDITEANPGTSSTAGSNYQYNVTLNRNEELVDTAYFEIEHRFVLNLGYTHQFVDGYDTNIDLFFERRSGRPFTWVLGAHNDGDLGDQRKFNRSDVYVPYIPTGADDPNIDWSRSLSWEDTVKDGEVQPGMKTIIEQAGLSGYAGGYVNKNDSTQPWVTTLDLNITQEIPGFAEDHKGIFYVTVANLANLLNDDWGQVYQMRFPQQILFDYDVNDAGQYRLTKPYGGFDTRNYDEFKPEQSTWRLKMGLRYKF